MYKNALIKKLRMVSKFLTAQFGKQIITIHILFNISRSKGSQIMNFGLLIEYNLRNIFLEKLCTTYGREASPRSLYKKSKFNVSADQQSEML